MGKGSERESGKSAPKGGEGGGVGLQHFEVRGVVRQYPSHARTCMQRFISSAEESWASMTDEGGLDILPTETVIYIDSRRTDGRHK